MQLMKYHVNVHRISHIFISHLHGDHYLGLMGLLYSMHLHHRANDLHLYSHRGLDDIITTQLRASYSYLSFKINFHELVPDKIITLYDDTALTVETIPLRHRLPCSGFLFREKPKPRRIDKERLPTGLLIQQIAGLKRGLDVVDENGTILYANHSLTLAPHHARSYAYCSDTAYLPDVVEQISGVDVLYHEATFMEEELAKAQQTLHSTARQAAQIAAMASVKKLLIGHFSARYRELEPLLAEATREFPNTHLANDGDVFSLME